MNDTRRKMHTEYLGECWHEIKEETYSCRKCGMSRAEIYTQPFAISDNRTFTTAQDMVDLVRKMVEKWEWDDCHSSLWDKWTAQCEDEEYPIIDYVVWLITDPARTCELIADWKEASHEGR